jgi:hypothetical protein
MRSVAELEAYVETPVSGVNPAEQATAYLHVGEEMLEHWLAGKDLEPTHAEKEGFRILALHRQGCKGDPSFNACRETCRELVYYYNLVVLEPAHADIEKRLAMMQMVVKHVVLFIGSKMQEAQIGEFCCSSKVNRLSKKQRNLDSNAV